MAESPPTGGLSAFKAALDLPFAARGLSSLAEHQSGEPVDHELDKARKRRRTAADQGTMSFSVAVNRSPDSSSSPSMCRRAGPVSVHSSRKYAQPGRSGSSDLTIASTGEASRGAST